ncbi:MAG TPA: hypothetical protein VNG29_04535 [Candidatus Paceibacterota bacterium]|nr:hypothetical protein [Candidatus Paceibacterota bacterium]
MKIPKQKIIVIYHGDCRDGFGGAWAAWKKFGAKAAYLPARDRFGPPCEIKNKEVYLIDYTYQPEVVEKLIRENKRVTAIDHHFTAEPAVKLTERCSFSLHHSGAILAWNYFHPGKKSPMLLRYVEDYDLWRWRMPHLKEVILYLDLIPFGFADWTSIARSLETKTGRAAWIKDGNLLLRQEKSIVRELLQGSEQVRFMGRTVYAVNAPHRFVDDLGHELALRTNSFGIVWSERAGVIKVSLRAVGSTDISGIARKLGGGGHKQSGAFRFSADKPFPWKRIKK